MTAPAGVVDLSLPDYATLVARAGVDPRAEAARVAGADPGTVAGAGALLGHGQATGGDDHLRGHHEDAQLLRLAVRGVRRAAAGRRPGERAMIAPEELRHVDEGPRPGERAGTGLAEIVVTTPGAAEELLGRCREVLRAVLAAPPGRWPDDEEWAERLPAWFVGACAPERTPDEAAEYLARWRRLDAEARARVAQEESWSLSNWLFWLQPDERTWYWWDGVARGPREALVVVEVPGWPAPLGSLDWMLRAAGAESIDKPDGLS